MSNPAVLQFVRAAVQEYASEELRILEVGSYDRAGDSIRREVERFAPTRYVGVDLEAGPGVDVVASVHELSQRFSLAGFDCVISTEMIEHVEDWRSAVVELKGQVAPGGMLLVTTRSRGFHLHAYPNDYWRYEIDDMYAILADFERVVVSSDPLAPGVFAHARRPTSWSPDPAGLDGIRLYSVAFGRRIRGNKRWVNQIGAVLVRMAIFVREVVRNVAPPRLVERAQRAKRRTQ